MIEIALHESNIFIYHWRGNVTMEEARGVIQAVNVLNQGKPFAAIVDMRELTRLPRNITQMQANIKADIREGLCGYVILGGPPRIRALVRTLSVLAPTTYKFTQDFDKAVAMARTLVAEREMA